MTYRSKIISPEERRRHRLADELLQRSANELPPTVGQPARSSVPKPESKSEHTAAGETGDKEEQSPGPA